MGNPRKRVKHHGPILRTSSAIPSAKLKEPVASDVDGFRWKPCLLVNNAGFRAPVVLQ